jgi:hypothetical protein
VPATPTKTSDDKAGASRMSRSPTRATGASVALANACEFQEREQRIDCVDRV